MMNSTHSPLICFHMSPSACHMSASGFSRLYPFSALCCACVCLLFIFTAMANSASFHGVVGLQNGSRYQIDKKNYDAFIATPELGDVRINVFTFGANMEYRVKLWKTGSIYWMHGPLLVLSSTTKANLRTFHLFADDDLQPLPDGSRAFPTVVIAGRVSCSTFSVKQENGFDMDVS
ncbi:hypothetical protein C8R48DRAFT_836896 [Suillus tomentosus]|nr:hypothetical protein C8R48DRAFT_836896 [Suillus tomentosus]